MFTPTPFASFRSARNSKSFLVRSKVYPLNAKVVSEKCNGKRYLACLNVSEMDAFESFQAKKQYKINHNLNCNGKCLIYLLSCKICGLQYVGSTTDASQYRWNNFKDNNRKTERGVEHMHEHSHGHNGFLENCTITLTDKTDGVDSTSREEY